MLFFLGWKSCTILSRRNSYIRFLKNVSEIFFVLFSFLPCWICTTAAQMQYTYFFIKSKYSIIYRVSKTILPKTNFWKLFRNIYVVRFHSSKKRWYKNSINISYGVSFYYLKSQNFPFFCYFADYAVSDRLHIWCALKRNFDIRVTRYCIA